MTLFVVLCVLGLALLPLIISIRRSTELFLVKVRDGDAIFSRGRMPQSLLDDIADVVGSPRIERAELRAVRRGGQPELVTRGDLSSDQLQRLRNVLGRYSVQRIAAGGAPAAGSRIARRRGGQ
jgi:hypothetical protein